MNPLMTWHYTPIGAICTFSLTLSACGASNSTGATGTSAAADAVVSADTAPEAGASASDAVSEAASAEVADITADVNPVDAAAAACPPAKVLCTDNQISDLSLLKKASTRSITNTTDGQSFASVVDATAGGFSPNESFLYAKFTETGLERVDVGDQAALDSVAWDIAFRRYVVRLNSGVSGPSCVTGAAFASGVTFEQVIKASSTLTMQSEAYYDAGCKLVGDNSGLSSPATVLNSFWKYEKCVQMTGKIFQIKLADGRFLKVNFTAFYAPEAQATCDSTGNVPQGTVGAKIMLRWAELTK